jgi:hypothetical protein
MEKIVEFRRNAELCRRLAARAGPHEGDLLRMAKAWEQLAAERERRLNGSNKDK